MHGLKAYTELNQSIFWLDVWIPQPNVQISRHLNFSWGDPNSPSSGIHSSAGYATTSVVDGNLAWCLTEYASPSTVPPASPTADTIPYQYQLDDRFAETIASTASPIIPSVRTGLAPKILSSRIYRIYRPVLHVPTASISNDDHNISISLPLT